jgi:hypothetical protein
MFANSRCLSCMIHISGPLGLAILLLVIAVGEAVGKPAVHSLNRGNAPTTSSTWIYGVSDSAASEQHPVTGKTETPTVCQSTSQHSSDACCRTDSTPKCGDLWHSKLSISLVTSSDSPNSQSLLQLRHLGSMHVSPPKRSLAVLFCSWQA